jgi:hypothetical protein
VLLASADPSKAIDLLSGAKKESFDSPKMHRETIKMMISIIDIIEMN